METERRKPLSPVKTNQRLAARPTPFKPQASPATSEPDVFSSPFIQAAMAGGTRIPRATPTPQASSQGASSVKPRRSSGPTRIPRLRLEVLARRSGDKERSPAGFQAYINPSFDGGSSSDDSAEPALPALATPEAVELLQRMGKSREARDVGSANGVQKHVSDTANAYVRTGPQKLSPEPCRDYCIQAPKPAGGVAGKRQAQAPHFASSQPNNRSDCRIPAPKAAHQGTRTTETFGQSAAAPSTAVPAGPTPSKRAQEEGVVPSSVCSNVPTEVSVEPDVQNAPPACQLQENEPAIRLLHAVDVNGEIESDKDEEHINTDRDDRIQNFTNDCTSESNHSLEREPHSPADEPLASEAGAAQAPEDEGTPVTFQLPGDEGEEKDDEEIQQRAASADSAPSTNSFSFGMGGGGGVALQHDPTPEAIAPPKCGTMHARTDSADSVDQPNPFASVLHHLREGGPMAFVSPARGAATKPLAPWQEGSPQSPEQCTPMQLLPEGVPPSATPELGKGNLQAWIDRRGMRGALCASAAADLQRLWTAMRESVSARAATEAAMAENQSLRNQLEEARAALKTLQDEHQATTEAAEAGKQWAEAEVLRAREAATHMMALADQIQATFALCEQEKCVLAEELQAARLRAESAEQAAGMAEREHLAKEVTAAREAAERAEEEAHAAREAARTSASELAGIKTQLDEAQAQLQLMAAGDESDVADDCNQDGATTPLPVLRQRLRAAHEALASLCASARWHTQVHSEGDAIVPVSPAMHRLISDYDEGLDCARELLAIDEVPVERMVDTEDLAKALSEVSGQIEELQSQEQAAHGQNGTTLTVDFCQLSHIMSEDGGCLFPTEHANPSVPPTYMESQGQESDISNMMNCSVEVEGLLVTNIPPGKVSQVRALVSYFEALTHDDAPAAVDMQTEPADPSGYEVAKDAIPFEALQAADLGTNCNCTVGGEDDHVLPQAQSQLHRLDTTPCLNADAFQNVVVVTETFQQTVLAVDMQAMPEEENVQSDGREPSAAPDIEDCGDAVDDAEDTHINDLAAAAAINVDIAFYEENALATPGPPVSRSHPDCQRQMERSPSTPACTPADESTPALQRRHMAAIEALAAMHASPQEEEPELGVPSTSMVVVANQQREITPINLDDLRQSGGTGLRDEVRARLQRLKADLQQARNKLTSVDRGLAAIATPNSQGRPLLLVLPAPQAVSQEPPRIEAALPEPQPLPLPSSSFSGVFETGRAPFSSSSSPPAAHTTEARAAVPSMRCRQPTLRSALKASSTPIDRTHRGGAKTPRTRPSVHFAPSVKLGSAERRPPLRPDTPCSFVKAESTTANSVVEQQVVPHAAATATPTAAPARAPVVITTSAERGDENRQIETGCPSPASAWAQMLRGSACSAAFASPAADDVGAPRQSVSGSASPPRRLRLDMYDEHSDSDSYGSDVEENLRRDNFGGMTPASSRAAIRRGSLLRTPVVMGGFSPHKHATVASVNKPATKLTTPRSTTRFAASVASSSSAMFSPDPAAVLSIKSVVGGRVRRGGGNGGARRPSESEEREFRRRAAALKIHVSPYFKRTGGARAARCAEGFDPVTMAL